MNSTLELLSIDVIWAANSRLFRNSATGRVSAAPDVTGVCRSDELSLVVPILSSTNDEVKSPTVAASAAVSSFAKTRLLSLLTLSFPSFPFDPAVTCSYLHRSPNLQPPVV